MDPIAQFNAQVARNISEQAADTHLYELSHAWTLETARHGYSYNFSWLGRPVIQYPQDMVAMQELIWSTRPDLIIETGIAHGGSLVLYASILALLDLCDGKQAGAARKVLGIDIDIRSHNRAAIESHPMSSRIQMIQGSSIAPETIAEVQAVASQYRRILVCLDAMHTHDHVLKELEAYASLVNVGSYCVVFDTLIEDMPAEMFADRPWNPGNNPKTAVREYLRSHPEFEVDKNIQHKLLITVAPDGFLRRIK